MPAVKIATWNVNSVKARLRAKARKKASKKRAAKKKAAKKRATRKRKAPRRLSAKEMARTQREISVAEFFAKNRHLLGYDNPSKALLTAVREAVDNALDACEEGGILPDIDVAITHVKAGTGARGGKGDDGAPKDSLPG